MAFHLKLLQPKELPADGLTSAEFKPWTNHLTNFLQQEVENFRFLKGVEYSTWSPDSDNESNKRIVVLHVSFGTLLSLSFHCVPHLLPGLVSLAVPLGGGLVAPSNGGLPSHNFLSSTMPVPVSSTVGGGSVLLPLRLLRALKTSGRSRTSEDPD